MDFIFESAVPSRVAAARRQEESQEGVEELHDPLKRSQCFFIQCSKHFICINSLNSQNNLVMVFIIFSDLELKTMKLREVK